MIENWDKSIPVLKLPVEESVYDRVRRYRKEGLEHHKRDVKDFRQAVRNGDFPAKCLKCYESGLVWCRFWATFDCEEFEKKVVDEKIERLL